MRKRRHFPISPAHKALQGLALGCVCAAAAMVLWTCCSLDWLESATWTWRVRALYRKSEASRDICLALLDQTSLDWAARLYGWPWPWPREAYAAVLDFCRRAPAKAVAIDLILSEPSREGVEDDQLLGRAMAESGNVAAALVLSRSSGAEKWPTWLPRTRYQCSLPSGMLERLPALAASRASFPVREVATNAAVLGSVSLPVLREAVVTRVPAFAIFDGAVVPALGLAAFMAADPAPSLYCSNGYWYAASRLMPLDRRGNVILRFRGPSQTHRAINVAALIHSEMQLREGSPPLVRPEALRGAYVLIGLTAPGLMDLKPAPVSPVYPGVEIHATFLDNVLSGDFIRDVPPPWTAALALAFAATAAVLGRLCAGAGHMVALFIFMTPLPFAAGVTAYQFGFWLPVSACLSAEAMALIGSAVINYATEGRQKRFIRNAFRQYQSPAVVEQLLRHPERLKLGGELRELTILFTDISGFTSLAEQLQPETVTSFLNEYLTAVSEIVLAEDGTIDKYEGDAVVAFWNAPLDQPDHAARAVRAALRCKALLADLNPAFREKVGADIFTRFGINTGRVVVGNMGSRKRFDYTFVGDAGNLASRIEGINKYFGTSVLVSETTKDRAAGEFAFREIALVQVAGRSAPVRLFEPMFKEDCDARSDLNAAFARALQLYYCGRFAEAADLFAALSDRDTPAQVYLDCCRSLAVRPPPEWNGVWVMSRK